MTIKPDVAAQEAKTLDWTRRHYTLQIYDGGQRLFMVAWSDDGPMPRDGDYLILRNGERQTRYRVDECRSTMSEGDVCTLRLTFAPRQAEEQT